MIKQEKSKYLLGPVATEFSNTPTGKWKNMKPVVIQSECKLCKQCMAFCPVDAIDINASSQEKVSILYEYCKGCGICANVCTQKCILMKKMSEK